MKNICFGLKGNTEEIGHERTSLTVRGKEFDHLEGLKTARKNEEDKAGRHSTILLRLRSFRPRAFVVLPFISIRESYDTSRIFGNVQILQ